MVTQPAVYCPSASHNIKILVPPAANSSLHTGTCRSLFWLTDAPRKMQDCLLPKTVVVVHVAMPASGTSPRVAVGEDYTKSHTILGPTVTMMNNTLSTNGRTSVRKLWPLPVIALLHRRWYMCTSHDIMWPLTSWSQQDTLWIYHNIDTPPMMSHHFL